MRSLHNSFDTGNLPGHQYQLKVFYFQKRKCLLEHKVRNEASSLARLTFYENLLIGQKISPKGVPSSGFKYMKAVGTFINISACKKAQTGRTDAIHLWLRKSQENVVFSCFIDILKTAAKRDAKL